MSEKYRGDSHVQEDKITARLRESSRGKPPRDILTENLRKTSKPKAPVRFPRK